MVMLIMTNWISMQIKKDGITNQIKDRGIGMTDLVILAASKIIMN